MKAVTVFLTTLIILSSHLFGGTIDVLLPNSPSIKKLNFSLDFRKHDKDEDKLIVTVKADVLYGIRSVNLLVENKNTEITPVINEWRATIEFEIDKKTLDKSYLTLSYNIKANGADIGCTNMYQLSLEDFIK